MKKFLLSFVLLLFTCTFVFSACGKKGLTDNPATDADVLGNGGYAVVKGDYLYYVNGYIDNYADTLKSDTSLNKEGNVVFGGIYRTKLVNRKLQKDENGFLVKTEQVVSKLVGFENGGFYVLGDNIYFTSPHMNQDGSGVVRTDYTSFYKVNIDGTDCEELYVSKSVSVADWNVYEIDGTQYVVLVEKVNSGNTTQTNIVSINAKTEKTNTIATNVQSFVLNQDNKVEAEYDKYVYYTFNDDNGINKLAKAKISDGTKAEYQLISGATYSLVDLKNDNLYLTIKNGSTKLYRLDLQTSENLTNITPYELTDSEYASYYVMDGVLNNIVAVDSENYMYYIVNGTVNKLLLSSSVTFIALSDNCVYYLENSALKRISVLSGEIETIGASDKTYLANIASQIDVDGSRIFMFAQYTAEDSSVNYYLNVTDIFADKNDSQFVGLFKDGHTPKQPTAEEKEAGKIWVK